MSESFTLPDLEPFVEQIERAIDTYRDRPDFLKVKVAEIWERMELEAEVQMESITLDNGHFISRPGILDHPVRH